MRLCLSSYRLSHPTELSDLVGNGNRRAAVIANPSDSYPPQGRQERLDREINDIKAIGCVPEELDLRDYFGKADKLKEKLKEFGLVWIKGGNAFVLKRAMEQSGFDVAIKELLADDTLVYAGYSAAAVIAAPTLKGIELVDDATAVPEGYRSEFSWDGLNLVPYSIAPHYKSDHPESAAVDTVVEYFEEHHMPYKTLRDGETILIQEESERLIGA